MQRVCCGHMGSIVAWGVGVGGSVFSHSLASTTCLPEKRSVCRVVGKLSKIAVRVSLNPISRILSASSNTKI